MFKLNWLDWPAIDIAKTVSDIALFKNHYARVIMDRSQTVEPELVGAIMAQGVMGYEGRRPRPALDARGDFQGTDLDLLSFLVPLAAREAVIEFPRYRNRRPRTKRANERHLGTGRFGPLTGLVSHRKLFSFSVRIFDHTIAVTEKVGRKETLGAHRNFMVVDARGRLYSGWDRIVWDPSLAENRFLGKRGLWTGNSVVFSHWVHPNRWQSVFGAPHLLKKMLLARLEDEIGFYRQEMVRLEERGLRLPQGEKKDSPPSFPVGQPVSRTVATMAMDLELPAFSGRYTAVRKSQNGLVQAYRRQKYLAFTLRPAIQFAVRANEAAFFFFGNAYGVPKVASWLGRRSWHTVGANGKGVHKRLAVKDGLAMNLYIKEVAEKISA